MEEEIQDNRSELQRMNEVKNGEGSEKEGLMVDENEKGERENAEGGGIQTWDRHDY